MANTSNCALEMQNALTNNVDNSSQIISLNASTSQLKRIFLKPNLNDPSSNIMLKPRLSFSTKNLNILNSSNVETQNTTTTCNPSYNMPSISLIQKVAANKSTTPSMATTNVSTPKSTLAASDDSLLLINDEFDSPLNMKDNILTSMRKLKPSLVGLDVLRSSISDEDEAVVTEANNTHFNSQLDNVHDNKKTKLSQLLTGAISQCDNGKACLPKPTRPTPSLLPVNEHQSDLIKKANKSPNKVNRSSYYIASKSNNNNNNEKMYNATQTQINLPPKLNHINTNINNINNINNIAMKQSCKRGKEEALSNSSSSDEEDSQQRNQNEHADKSDQNQNLLCSQPVVRTTPISIRPSITSSDSNHSSSSYSHDSSSHPVLTTIAFNPNKANGTCQTLTLDILDRSNNDATSKVGANNMQSAVKACKSDHDYNSKYYRETPTNQHLNESPIFSSASSTASYSSINSVTSPSSNANETIDFLDDNSSTASGPIYVRQPGNFYIIA